MVQKAINQIAKEIVGGGKRVLVAIGSTKFEANSPIRGYVRTPQPKLLRRLKVIADVVEVDEYRTTILCSTCHTIQRPTTKTYISRKGTPRTHRYQFCPNCNICWNRDVNAGKNILYLARCTITSTPINNNFSRSK